MKRTVDMILCALFAALITVGAFIRISVFAVPFTLQFLFTALAGLLLGSRLGAMSVVTYIVMGLIGLPVFTGGGGIGYIIKPTFGYLIGFAIGTYVTGMIAERSLSPSVLRLFAANLAGLGIAFLVGMIHYYLISRLYLNTDIGIWALFLACVAPFAPIDIFLSLIAAFAAKRIIPIKNKYCYSNQSKPKDIA